MGRRIGVAAAVAAVLAFAPSASAWRDVARLAYPVDLVGLRTQRGAELLAWEGGPDGRVPREVLVLRVAGATELVAALPDDELFTAPPVLLQQPRGTLLLYYSTTRGAFRATSTDDGRSWSDPTRTLLRRTERVLGGTVRPDGTPLLTVWDWTGDSDETPLFEVVQGLDGELRHPILGGGGSVAVTPDNRAYLVGGYSVASMAVQRLDAAGAPVGPRSTLDVLPAGPPLADRFGDVLVPAIRKNRLLVVDVGHGRPRVHVVARSLWLAWGAPLLADPRGGVSSLWAFDRAYLAVRSTNRGVAFDRRTAPHEPPNGGSTISGGRAPTAAIAWAHGVDLFAAYDDRIVRERFRVR